MKSEAVHPSLRGAFAGRIRLDGELSAVQARALLKLRFSTADQDRMRDLSAKARAGSLSAEEAADIDAYERLGCLLDILHSKARRALRKRPRTS